MIKIQKAVITAKRSELEDIGIQGFFKGDIVEVWDYGQYPDKEHGDCSKFAKQYDNEYFFYIPNKFIEIVWKV